MEELTKCVFTEHLEIARISPACVFDQENKVLYIYGGFDEFGKLIHTIEMITLGSSEPNHTFNVSVNL